MSPQDIINTFIPLFQQAIKMHQHAVNKSDNFNISHTALGESDEGGIESCSTCGVLNQAEDALVEVEANEKKATKTSVREN